MGNNRTPNASLVWSSELGRVCPDCGKAVAACVCKKKVPAQNRDGIVRIRRETKGRGGKTVTVVAGIPLDDAALKELATELKRRCGSGGTVKDGMIEIQGEHIATLMAELTKQGYAPKKSGG